MAALDPNIILGIKPLNLAQPDPLERYTKLAGFETTQLALDKARQERADDEATRGVFREGGTESEILKRLMGVSPKAGLAYQKQLLEAREKEANIGLHTAQAGRANWEVERERASRGAALIGEAKDQESFEQIIRFGVTGGLYTPQQGQQMLAQGYSPENIKRWQASSLTYQQQLEEQGRQATRDQTRATAPFTAGPGGVSVPNVPVQEYELSRRPGATPHYDADRGIVVDPRTGQGTPITVGGQPVGAKPNAATQKELMSIGQQEATVDGALAAIKATPSAFGRMRGAATMMGPVTESVVGGFDSKEEREARSYVFNIVSKVINERAGAAQSAQELARLRSFLPGELDNADQITDKLNAFKTYLADLRKGTTASAPPQPGAPTPSPAPPGAAPNPGTTITGSGPSLRVPPQAQNALDDDAARIRAREAGKNIDSDIADLERELKRPGLGPEQIATLSLHLRLLKRGKELNSGGTPATGRIVKRTGTLNGRKVVEYSDGAVEYAK